MHGIKTYEDSSESRHVDCVLSDGTIVSIADADTQKELLYLFENGMLESNLSTFYSKTAQVNYSEMTLQLEDPGDVEYGKRSDAGRTGTTTTGTRTMLAVRTIAAAP